MAWHEDGMNNNGVKWDSWSGSHGVDNPWHGVQDKECVGNTPPASPTLHEVNRLTTCYNGTQDREYE